MEQCALDQRRLTEIRGEVGKHLGHVRNVTKCRTAHRQQDFNRCCLGPAHGCEPLQENVRDQWIGAEIVGNVQPEFGMIEPVRKNAEHDIDHLVRSGHHRDVARFVRSSDSVFRQHGSYSPAPILSHYSGRTGPAVGCRLIVPRTDPLVFARTDFCQR